MKKGLRQYSARVMPWSASVRTVDLMKKGLRLCRLKCVLRRCRQNRRPDEEGIKTLVYDEIVHVVGQNRRPDEEGIKTRLAWLS